jgi:hypothetical protein
METTQPSSTHNNEHPAPAALEEARPVKKRAGFWRRTGMVLAWLLLIFLVLGFGIGLFVQLPVFRRLAVNEVTSLIENGTNGRLTIGDIQGNLFEGFVMTNVTLRLKTRTAYDTIPLLHADRILARYSLLHWLRTNEIGISSLVLQRPVIRFVRFEGDTSWNYELLSKSNGAKSPSKPFSQIIDLAQFQIQNGSFYLRDYNSLPRKATLASLKNNEIDWSNVEVEGIDLESRFHAQGAKSQSVHVGHLQFRETHSGLFVQRFGFSGYLDSSQARIDNAKIITGHSNLGFSIKISPPKIIETGLLTSIKNSLVEANVSGPVISTYELKQFLPEPLGFLAGSPGIDLTATGEFGKLHIKKLSLDFKNQGTITISGDLNNLQQSDSLTMNLNLHAKNLSNGTLNDYVPGLHLPDLGRFGMIDIPNLTFIGAPQNFHTTFDAKSSGAGDAAGNLTLDVRKKEMVYRAGLKTNNFNLAALVHRTDFESSITAETQIAGRGTNWKTMAATITLKTNGQSTFNTYQANSLDLAGAMKNGTITIDHLDGLMQDGPEVHIRSAMSELSSPTFPFRFDGSIANFPLAKVMNSETANSARLDLEANLSGTAKDFDEIFGTAHVRLFDLTCQEHALLEDTADITISAVRPDETKLTLHSSLADATIDGRFQTGDLLRAVPAHLNALLIAIGNRDFQNLTSILTPIKSCTDSLDLDYRLQIKDLRALANFLPNTFVLGQGVLSGSIVGCENGDLSMRLNGDSVAFIVRDRPSLDSMSAIVSDSTARPSPSTHRDTTTLALPKFGSGTPRIHLMPTTFRLTLNHLSNDSQTALENLDAELDFKTDSVIRLGSALLYNPHIGLNYKNEVLNFDARSDYNNAIGIHLKGNALFPKGDLDCELDSFVLTYKNPYFTPTSGSLREFSWRNEGTAHIQLAKDGLLTVDTFHIIHPLKNGKDPDNVNSQRMSFGGTLHSDSVHAWLNLPSFGIEDLRRILPFNPKAKTFDYTKYAGKIRDVGVTVSGTLEQPEIAAKLFADSLTYVGEDENTITFDSNYLNFSYRDQKLRGILDIHVANVEGNAPSVFAVKNLKGGELRATIDSIPMAIAFQRGPSFAADSARAAKLPLSASVRAQQFPLDIATPFLPPFRTIMGTGDINFTVNGTRENIQYAGKASIRNGELLLASTNMWYLFGGQIAFAHNALTFQNDSIHNISADDSLGGATLNGSFTFSGFDITNFDLRLRSDRIMVLSDAAKESLPDAYGTVTINTGGQDFHFRNTFDAPQIAGTINIMSADVTLPPTDNAPQSASGQDVIYETLPQDTLPIVLPNKSFSDSDRQKYTAQVASVQMSEFDDALFPNSMKNIYRNDDGSMPYSNSVPTMADASHSPSRAPSFTDVLRMDLLVNTEGNAEITMPFGVAFGLLGSQLTADLKSGGSLKIERADDLDIHAYGGFELSPNSIFTYIRNFTIPKGNISFTNNFTNPHLDINAEYIGPRATDASALAKITLRVTGTKNQPTITWENYLQPTPGADWVLKPDDRTAAEKQEDAIYFLGTGYFKTDLASGNTGPGALYSKMLQSLGNQFAGNFLTNIAGSTSSQFAIRAATLDLGNYGAQVTAAYRDITFKLGGANNQLGYGANFVTDIPLSDLPLFSADAYRNLMVEIQANYNQSSSVSASSITQQPSFLTKFVYVWHPGW